MTPKNSSRHAAHDNNEQAHITERKKFVYPTLTRHEDIFDGTGEIGFTMFNTTGGSP